jgi:hypothetical protein
VIVDDGTSNIKFQNTKAKFGLIVSRSKPHGPAKAKKLSYTEFIATKIT